MTIWKELDTYTAFNSAVVSSGSESITNKDAKFSGYNRLMVQNLDVVDIELRLDQLTLRTFRVSKNGGYITIEPEAGLFFRSVQNVNLSTTTNQTANKILFRFAYAQKVD